MKFLNLDKSSLNIINPNSFITFFHIYKKTTQKACERNQNLSKEEKVKK